ncbi:DUF1989 domain-containing protein [Pelagibius litoralis]|uniref:DUF1989 domain-containing protein n=1 Tax=Pelagibius litoralis TaxID=374515 RepID=A0A967K8K2_9PROT|nr:aminomethyltransferase family protein [Pelagibius litoralis]NIA69297.1 DUF1989 domain-containing protein [Pelagibius litoralis]
MQIHAPARQGLTSRGARYPGHRIADSLEKTGSEQRFLRAGTALHLGLKEGDLVDLVDEEGATPARLFAVDGRGEPAFAALGLASLATEVLDLAAFDSGALTAWVAARGGNPQRLTCLTPFEEDSPAGTRLTLRVSADCDLWIALPCLLERVIAGGAGGSLEVSVQRAGISAPALPPLLGDLREELRIDRATARAYELRKGDYVQIIDVEGRQCSDFTALSAAALDRGLERHIDSTVTRTLVGGAYPAPGLFDKFFDQDMSPLLRVTRDTVGRHDTFALACTARGYEERGFPGHVNCSDNISEALEPFGVGHRSAWPAINFFFNSWIPQHDNRLRVDEAWSRAGDYVVMQALSDLVCVSTACPDDVDPINGWNPTDIHVRIYRPDQPIRRAVAYRPTPDSEAILTAESAFHPRTSKLTRAFQVARDLWLPSSYEATRALDEYWACRSAVTLQDMSSLRKLDIMGPDAEALLQHAMTRDVAKLSLNRGIYSLLCDETGAVIDDGTLFRMAPQIFRWCCGSDESARQLKDLARARGDKVWIKSLWSSMPNLALQGPHSRDLLREVVFTQPTQPSLDNLKWFGFTVARLNDRDGAPFMLTRSGFTGELGYEIFCDHRHALEIWDALMEKGRGFGILPMGLEALETLRIEAGLMVAGAEFLPGVDALEAGLGFAISKGKTGFVGSEALLRNGTAPSKRLTGLLFDGDEVPAHGDGVFHGRRQIGQVTSATRSPSLQRAIAMARLAVEFAEPGTALEVGQLDGQMKRLSARVCEIPFVDPKRERARA